MSIAEHKDTAKPAIKVSADRPLQRGIDLAITTVLMLAAAISRLFNFGQWPGVDIDEGFYTSQAWAFVTHGWLTPHGYIWDHPPVGWIQMAGWFGTTNALSRHHGFIVLAGREFMVVMAIATAALLYLLCRRLELRRVFAILAVLAWVLSPMANSLTRLTLLDNIAMPWLLASLVLLLNPGRKLWMTAASGVCFGVAVLTKEIMLLALPVLVILAWQHFQPSDAKVRRTLWRYLGISVLAVIATYPVVALFTGHFGDFWNGQVLFQLTGRSSKGSIFDPASAAHDIVWRQWLSNDHMLPIIEIVACAAALVVRRLRGPAVLVLVHAAILLWPDRFLPTAFIVVMLPFMALVLMGFADAVWPRRQYFREGRLERTMAVAGCVMVVVVAAVLCVGSYGSWRDTYSYAASAQETVYQQQAVTWAHDNLHPGDVVVTDYNLWLDIVNAGLPEKDVANPYQFDHEWSDARRQTVTYLVISIYSMPEKGDNSSLLTQLAGRSEVVQKFGDDGDYRQMFVLRARR